VTTTAGYVLCVFIKECLCLSCVCVHDYVCGREEAKEKERERGEERERERDDAVAVL
jgi:hypothetical protein